MGEIDNLGGHFHLIGLNYFHYHLQENFPYLTYLILAYAEK